MIAKHASVRLLVGLSVVLCTVLARGANPAFPGAEGGGAASRGGRGGKIIQVTNLNDEGPGSLRAACEAEGPRTVVFRTGGIITLTKPIDIRNPFLTIAGQTAPGGGILIRTEAAKFHAINVHTNDVVIRFIRIRNAKDGLDAMDATFNLVVDHCSVSWGRDENMSIAQPSNRITCSWVLNAECFMPHSCGILIHGAGWNLELSPQMKDVDVHHNLFMHNMNRNPKIKAMNCQSINNICYDWQWWAAAYAGGVEVDLVGNLFKRGPNFLGEDVEHCCGFLASPVEFLWRADYTTGPPDRDPSVYIRDNKGPTNDNPANDNWSMQETVNPGWVRTHKVPDRRFARDKPQARQFPISVHPVEKLEAALLPDVGCSRRLDENGKWVPNRDAVDLRLIEEYRTGTGKMIYKLEDAGGFPTIDAGTPYPDADSDGMPDSWEKANGLNPNADDSAADQDGDGYTNVEEFLNGPTP